MNYNEFLYTMSIHVQIFLYYFVKYLKIHY